MAMASWNDPFSPEIHGHAKCRMGKCLQFIDDFNKATGKKITITHLVMKMTADTLANYKDFTGKIVCGCYVPYETVDISCMVNLDNGEDVDFFLIPDLNNKSLTQLHDEYDEKLKNLRTGKGYEIHKKITRLFNFLPPSIAGVLLELYGFISIFLGYDKPEWGLKKHTCGSMAIANIGTGGIEKCYLPIPSFLRVFGFFALNTMKDEPVIDNGKIVVDKVLSIMFSFDHRFGDGSRGTKALGEMKNRLENPYEFFRIE
ncbi:hypothetical protein SteCoe_27504 [Stentor coeruleus]|uniref:2-oxoacid dehydrogenase acyltransferase catalytic domain-containing protein n=1 Tax=Stentor coeruleus TaxID=5963 RepID=A0A1R2BAF1_9CILI|nr:hypothetical protein SteCoe_27504 [Stentor coeruleus]